MKSATMKKWMKLLAFAAISLAIGSSPALATIVTNTFTGTVSSGSDSTFGAGSLAGDAFTLTLTLDTTLGGVHQPNSKINAGTGSGPS